MIVAGFMSGTSMDGLDVSCARYYKQGNVWKFNLVASKTFAYTQEIKQKLIHGLISKLIYVT